MRGNTSTIKNAAMEFFTGKMGMSTKVTILMICDMVFIKKLIIKGMENATGTTAVITKEIGKEEFSTGKGRFT